MPALGVAGKTIILFGFYKSLLFGASRGFAGKWAMPMFSNLPMESCCQVFCLDSDGARRQKNCGNFVLCGECGLTKEKKPPQSLPRGVF